MTWRRLHYWGDTIIQKSPKYHIKRSFQRPRLSGARALCGRIVFFPQSFLMTHIPETERSWLCVTCIRLFNRKEGNV